MNTTAPLLMWNVWRSSGSIVCTAFKVSWSSEISSPSTTNIRTPPLANASLKSTGSEFTPGQQVVGEDDLLLGAGLGCLAGGFLVEHRRDERSGAALGLAGGCRSVTVSPIAGARRGRRGARIVRA